MIKSLIKVLILLVSIDNNALSATKNNLTEVSNEWTFRGEIVSAFNEAIKTIPLRENFLIYKVFDLKDLDGQKIRFELFYTGDDAEFYPQFYILTNARTDKETTSSRLGRAYYIKEFSSPDLELGEIAPKIDPFTVSDQQLKNFILNEFLDLDLTIRP